MIMVLYAMLCDAVRCLKLSASAGLSRGESASAYEARTARPTDGVNPPGDIDFTAAQRSAESTSQRRVA